MAPGAVHDDGTSIPVAWVDGGWTYRFDVPHFSGFKICDTFTTDSGTDCSGFEDVSEELDVKVRIDGVVSTHTGDELWDATNQTLHVEVDDHLTEVDMLVERAWVDDHIDRLAVWRRNVTTDIVDGTEYYVSTFPADETPTDHVLREYQASNKTMFTAGNWTSVQAPMGMYLTVDKHAGNVTVRPEVRSGVDATRVPLFVNTSLLRDHNISLPTAFDGSGERLMMSANRTGVTFRANASPGDTAVHILNDTVSAVEPASASCRDDTTFLMNWSHDLGEGGSLAQLFTRGRTFCWEWAVGLGTNISSENLSHYQIHGRVTNESNGELYCQIGFPAGDMAENTSVGAQACRGSGPRPSHVNATFQVHTISEPMDSHHWVGEASVGGERTSCVAEDGEVHLRTYDTHIVQDHPVDDLCNLNWTMDGERAVLAPNRDDYEEDQEAVVTNATHPVNVSLMERALVNLSDARYLIADEVLTVFNGSIPGNISEIVGPYGEVKLTNETLDMVVVSADSEYVVDEAVADLDAREDTKGAAQAWYYELMAEPNDDLYLDGRQPSLGYINATGAWNASFNRTYGGHEADIAILDAGIDRSHEDLIANTDCTDRHRDFMPRFDKSVRFNSASVTKIDHGTEVAGVAGARINNDKGMAGTANPCVTDVKVCGGVEIEFSPVGLTERQNVPACPVSRVAQGIQHVASLDDVEILSMSIGCPHTVQPACGVWWSPVKDAGQDAYNESGKLLIAAAGNSGPDSDAECSQASVVYPSKWYWWMSVGGLSDNGVDRMDEGGTDSNCGEDLSLAAPGADITTTVNRDGYALQTVDGTSVATPFVAGVAALVYDAHGLNNTNLRCTLLETAEHLWDGGNESTVVFGDGRVDAGVARHNPAGTDYNCTKARFNGTM